MIFRPSFLRILLVSSLLGASHWLVANTALDAIPKEGEGWQKFHRRYVERAKAGNISILFLGDSITQYWSDPRYGQKVWEHEFLPLKAENFGINGDRIQNVLWRIKNGEAEGLAPKAVVLLVGTNNTGYEKDRVTPRNTTEEVVKGISATVQELKLRFPMSKILLLGLLPRGKSEAPIRGQISEINRAIQSLSDGKHVFFMDIGDKFLGLNGEIPKEIMPDALHPSEKGYEIFAREIKETLNQWLAQ